MRIVLHRAAIFLLQATKIPHEEVSLNLFRWHIFFFFFFCKRMTLFYGYKILCLTKITRKSKSQRSTLERACAPIQEIAGEPSTAFNSLPDPWLINVAGDHPRPPHRGRVHLHPEIYRPAARCRKSPWRFNAMIFLIFFLAKYMGQHWWGR